MIMNCDKGSSAAIVHLEGPPSSWANIRASLKHNRCAAYYWSAFFYFYSPNIVFVIIIFGLEDILVFPTGWRGFSDRHLKCSYFQLMYSIQANLSFLGQIMQPGEWGQISNIANMSPYWRCPSQNVKSNVPRQIFGIMYCKHLSKFSFVQVDFFCSRPPPPTPPTVGQSGEVSQKLA